MSRQTACWAYRGRPDPRPCPERLPGPPRPTEPAARGTEGEPSAEVSADPGARRCGDLRDKSGAPAHQLTTKSSRDAAPWARGQERNRLPKRKGRLQLLTCASWVPGAVKTHILGRKTKTQRGAAPSASRPARAASGSGPESRARSPGPDLVRRQGRVDSPWRAARFLQGSGWSLCSRTLAGPSPGGGGRERRRRRLQNWLCAA